MINCWPYVLAKSEIFMGGNPKWKENCEFSLVTAVGDVIAMTTLK